MRHHPGFPRSPRQTLATILTIGLLAISGCSAPKDPTTDPNSPAAQVPHTINITCDEFNKLNPGDQQRAAQRLLASYKDASKEAAAQASARRDFGATKNRLADNSTLESPSVLTLARHTCTLPINHDVRLLDAMGFT